MMVLLKAFSSSILFVAEGEIFWDYYPDNNVQGANLPIWGRKDPGGPHEFCYLDR